MQLINKIPPSQEPVSLEELKLHLKIYGDEEDKLLQSYIKAGRETIEALTKRALLKQTWALIFKPLKPLSSPLVKFTRQFEPILVLPKCPLIKIIQVKINNEDFKDYIVSQNQITLSSGCVGKNVEIFFEAGYGESPEDIPETLRLAVKLCAAGFYQERTIYSAKAIHSLRRLVIPFQILSVG